jgi:2-polyprenyl-3-methyl-5-hydroxy-6-metoxy-1,4-benzoquinol methylase
MLKLIDQKRYGPKIRLLDYGAGKGFLSLLLSKQSDIDIYAADVVPNAFLLSFIQENKIKNINYAVLKDDALPYPVSHFDVVLLIEVVEHAEDPEGLVKRCLDMLKPSGMLIITTPPRYKFLFRPDPHFRLKYLYLLPLFVQNIIVERILKYSNYPGYHDVKVRKIYSNIFQFYRLCKLTGYKTRVTVNPQGSILTWRYVMIEKV